MNDPTQKEISPSTKYSFLRLFFCVSTKENQKKLSCEKLRKKTELLRITEENFSLSFLQTRDILW